MRTIFLSGLAALALLPPASAEPVVVTPMVPFFHKWQMENGPAMVDRAAPHAHGRIQFCITLQVLLGENARVEKIGLYQEAGGGKPGNAFHASNEQVNEQVAGYLRAAFARAVHHGLDISLLLHLNAHGENQEWRNNFDFDPLDGGKGLSYRDAMVRPVLKAIADAVPADWPVDLSLQGEMGTTVFRYPESWKTLIEESRRDFGAGQQRRVGLSFNYGGVAGRAGEDFPRDKTRDLWSICDFIGISLYHGVSSTPRPGDFDYALGSFAGEFNGLGSPLPASKPIHIIEIGIGGGGLSPENWQPVIPAQSGAQALGAPYLGTPEIEKNPWSNPELAKARRAYFDAFLDFAATPRERHPIGAIALWSFGSWDVQGIESPGFADPSVADKIKNHNQRVRRRK